MALVRPSPNEGLKPGFQQNAAPLLVNTSWCLPGAPLDVDCAETPVASDVAGALTAAVLCNSPNIRPWRDCPPPSSHNQDDQEPVLDLDDAQVRFLNACRQMVLANPIESLSAACSADIHSWDGDLPQAASHDRLQPTHWFPPSILPPRCSSSEESSATKFSVESRPSRITTLSSNKDIRAKKDAMIREYSFDSFVWDEEFSPGSTPSYPFGNGQAKVHFASRLKAKLKVVLGCR